MKLLSIDLLVFKQLLNLKLMRVLSYCKNCADVILDATRVQILESLAAKSPQGVNELVRQFTLRQPTISHHLEILRKSKFVTFVKKGNQVFYSINLNCHQDPTMKCIFLDNLSVYQKPVTANIPSVYAQPSNH